MHLNLRRIAQKGIRPRRFWRFSVRTALVLVTLFCLWFGPWAYQSNRQRDAAAAIEKAGGHLYYGYQLESRDDHGLRQVDRSAELPGPGWLRNYFGDHYFVTATQLYLIERPTFDPRWTDVDETVLANVKSLPHLEDVYIEHVELTSDELRHLRCLGELRYLKFGTGVLADPNAKYDFSFLEGLAKLENLELEPSGLDDDAAKHMAHLTQLRRLFIQGCPIGDEGAVYLGRLKSLELLTMTNVNITNVGLKALVGCQSLKSLAVFNSSYISDGCIEHLSKMTSLRKLTFDQTRVTQDGLRKLREALPNCSVNGMQHAPAIR